MANCQGCSAPLPANDPSCEYCGTYNDIDLQGRFPVTLLAGSSDHRCPYCQIPLVRLELAVRPALRLERCRQCLGLFFDLDGLSALLHRAVVEARSVNPVWLENIAKARYRGHLPVKYLRCPVCRRFMSRRNYGYKSGVVIDRCAAHGIWLDAGELRHLLEWKRAGGARAGISANWVLAPPFSGGGWDSGSKKRNLPRDDNSRLSTKFRRGENGTENRPIDFIDSLLTRLAALFDDRSN